MEKVGWRDGGMWDENVLGKVIVLKWEKPFFEKEIGFLLAYSVRKSTIFYICKFCCHCGTSISLQS